MTNEFCSRFVIENSIIVIFLAVMAEGITRWSRNARIANLLWLIVLTKFLIPSFLFCELPLLPSERALRETSISLHLDREFSNADVATQISTRQVEMPVIPDHQDTNSVAIESNKRVTSAEVSVDSKRSTFSISWRSAVTTFWVCGSLVWFSTFAIRLRQFRLGLRASHLASDSLQTLAKEIALKFQLKHAPEIRLVDDAISPILWSCGRNSQIILPAIMIADTSSDGMTAVLAHEIAHLKRLDHWAQRLAMLVLGLFWWHPAAWFAVKRLRQTQDACCDMDVLEWDSDLQIAFAKTLVEVASRVRSTAPPLALAFLDQFSLRARVQSILQETNRAKLGLSKSCVILFVGFSIASLSARIVAQTPAQIGTKSITPPALNRSSTQDSEIKNTSGSDSQTEIEVLEPDGSVATDARYVVGKRHTRFQLDASLNAVDVFSPKDISKTLQVDDGKIPLSFNPADECLAVWSEKGFFQIAISRLSTQKSLQLQGWVTLDVDLKTHDGPDAGATLSVSNHWTSDGQYSAMTLSNKTVEADQRGNVIVHRVAPGTIVMRTNVSEFKNINSSWTEHERSRTLQAESGATTKLSFGGTGRKIRGNVAFPEDVTLADFELLTGEVECQDNKESVRINIAIDGSFECEDVPFGQCKITIKSNPSMRRFRDWAPFSSTLSFECNSNESGIMSIGTLQLSRRAKSSATQEVAENMPSPDDFRSKLKVAVVGTEKRQKTIYTLFDNEGRLVRSLENIEVPVGWGSVGQYVAFDFPHDRLYLLSAYDEATKSQSLVTLDLTGKILSSRNLKSFSSFRVAVNTTTGDLWLLDVGSIGNSKVWVFDILGNQTKTYLLDAFTLCYSEVDKAFWLAGSRDVNKVDPASGESIASYRLPAGIWSITSIVPDPKGGVVGGEQAHPDMPKSANRIWRFDSNALQVGCVDVGSTRPSSVALIDNEIWVSGTTIVGSVFANPKVSNAFICFNRELERIQDRDLGFSFLGAEVDGKSVWAIHDKELRRVTIDHSVRIQTTAKGSSPIEGAIWASGN